MLKIMLLAVSWLLVKRIKNISFRTHMHWIFLFFICSEFVLGTKSWVTFSLFMHYSTATAAWLDKSRFLSLEKFESLWLVPLRCCELATLGAFFFFDLHWQHIYDQIWIVKCLAAKYWFNQKVSSSDSFKIILVYLYPFLLGFFAFGILVDSKFSDKNPCHTWQ